MTRDTDDTTNERSETRFGWVDAGPTNAHPYLLPALLAGIDRLPSTVTGDRLKIVDFGCGNGYVAAQLAARGHDVTAVDPAEDGIDIAQGRNTNVRFFSGSIYDPQLPDRLGRGADCAISLEVIEHLFRPAALFEAARETLRPGGRLFVSTPYHGYLKNLALSVADGWDRHWEPAMTGGHIKFFSRKALCALAARAGFAEVNFYGLGRAPWLWKSMLLEFELQRDGRSV